MGASISPAFLWYKIPVTVTSPGRSAFLAIGTHILFLPIEFQSLPHLYHVSREAHMDKSTCFHMQRNPVP